MIIQSILVAVAIFSFANISLNPVQAHGAGGDATQTVKSTYQKQTVLRNKARKTALAQDEYFAQQLAKLPIKLRPGTDHRADSRPTIANTRRCRSLVYQTYVQLPPEHTRNLAELTLYYTNDGRRGLGGHNVMVLRCNNVDKSELAAVFTHEIGHLVDGSYLTGINKYQSSGFYDFDQEVAIDDASLGFYRISWLSDKKRKSTARELDFVSLYAMSDPFEDFAETYMFYRLHGESFRLLKESSTALHEKYEFMKWKVFKGQEFGNDKVITYSDIQHRQYDATIIPFNLESFFTHGSSR